MQCLSEWGRHASRSWIFWSSAGAVIVVTTHILSRAVVRKLPPGTDSEANSDSQRADGAHAGKGERLLWHETPSGMQGRPAFNAHIPLNGRGEHHCSEDLCATVDLGIERSGLLKKSSQYLLRSRLFTCHNKILWAKTPSIFKNLLMV